ncbi:MAG: S9 family peptidase [Nannocystis sp.]|uniref:S9 family peptidase n=1 Tax=Nannocystis sp. TaxID=1962667 RepID=UPI0024291ADE|nr:S9 family peptidase [Nannocystis sp.]MBK9755220.1 S9 family peptidase [Nannocystis sp.]
MRRKPSTLAALWILSLACDSSPQKAPPAKPAKPVEAVVKPATTSEPRPEPTLAVTDDAHVPLPDSLVAAGIPPIPKAIAEAVGAYSEARSASVQGWHPRAHSLLISTRFADTAQVHEVKQAGGARRQLTFFRDRVGGASYPPAGDGAYLVFSKDLGGNEFAQNWRLDRATGQITLLTDGASKNTLGPWSSAGKQLAYTSTRRTRKDTDLYVVDPADPQSDRRVAEVEGGGWSPLDWSPDDQRLLALNYVSVNESYLWSFDVATGAKTLLTEKTGVPVSWSGGAFTADGKAVISTSDLDFDFKRLVRIDLADRKVAPLSAPEDWDVEDFAVTRDRKRLAAVINAGGLSRLQLHELPSGHEQVIGAEIPDGVIGGIHWHSDGKQLAFTLSSARSPADAYVLDTAKKTVERWTESEVGGLDPASFSEPKLVRWKSFDEREIPGFYYKPAARFTGKRPVVVVIHGGPEGQSEAGFIGRNNYLLNELGVALVYPNVRGSTGYGKQYVALDNGEKREDSVKDLGALLDWIAAEPGLDADRVMIMGGSYGGYMTLAASVHYADRIRCAVDIVGISNFVTFLEHTEAYRQDLRRVEYGDERDPAMRAKLQEISPLTHADKIKKPLFVIQGRNDPRVPASEAEQMVATLQKGGTPVWYLEGKDEGHGFSKKRNQDYQMYATILFMQTYLLDGMAP